MSARSVRSTIAGLAVAAVVVGVVPAAGRAAAADQAGQTGPVGTAVEVPGTAALNAGGFGQVVSVSCGGAAGNCAAGGEYTDGAGHLHVFVADEVNGVWQTAIEIPGTATLNSGNAEINSVSCGSAGNCVAGGAYADGAGHGQALVADEVNGAWQTAIELPGTATLNVRNANVYSLACGPAGNCAAGGYYTDSAGHLQALVASETNGVWQTGTELPGTAALNVGGDAAVYSVSCGSAGNCAADGGYTDSAGHQLVFVADEVNGVWQTAIEVPGTAALNVSGDWSSSVSCGSAGNCAAGGAYRDGANYVHAFVATEVSGVWQNAIEVPGIAALNAGGNATVNSVSCSSAGNCVIGGYYFDAAGHQQVFVADEVNGAWQTAIEVLGSASLNAGRSDISSVSCASAGNCAAGGVYQDGAGHQQVFVANEVNGGWHNAVEVPGTAALNAGGDANVFSVSCEGENCAVGGYYHDSAGNQQATVTVLNQPSWPANVVGPSRPPAFSAEGFYLGVTNGHAWTLEVTQPGRFPGHVYTATIHSNDGVGYFTNAAGIQLEGDDSFKVVGRTITFLSHDFGDIDGIRFVTSQAATSLTFTLAIDGKPATADQMHLGAHAIPSATPSPLTITR